MGIPTNLPPRKMKNATPRQMAYARRVWSGQGVNRKQIALDVGYAPSVANSLDKIEGTRGYQAAISKLASESNNLAVAVMAEFKARGFKDFSNKDLVGAMNAVGSAWAKFNQVPKDDSPGGENRLRAVILQRVENQVIQQAPIEVPVQPYHSPREKNPIKEDVHGAEENSWEEMEDEDRRVSVNPDPDVE